MSVEKGDIVVLTPLGERHYFHQSEGNAGVVLRWDEEGYFIMWGNGTKNWYPGGCIEKAFPHFSNEKLIVNEVHRLWERRHE